MWGNIGFNKLINIHVHESVKSTQGLINARTIERVLSERQEVGVTIHAGLVGDRFKVCGSVKNPCR